MCFDNEINTTIYSKYSQQVADLIGRDLPQAPLLRAPPRSVLGVNLSLFLVKNIISTHKIHSKADSKYSAIKGPPTATVIHKYPAFKEALNSNYIQHASALLSIGALNSNFNVQLICFQMAPTLNCYSPSCHLLLL